MSAGHRQKLLAVRVLGPKTAGRWQAAQIEVRQARTCELKKPLLTKNWIIGLPAVAVEGVVPVRLDIRVVARCFIPLPGGHLDRPAIRFQREIFGKRGHHFRQCHKRFGLGAAHPRINTA